MRQGGAADYVLKEGSLARLPVAVRRAIEEKRSRRVTTCAAALEESAERYRMLTDATFDAVVVSQNGILKEMNAGLAECSGMPSRNSLVPNHGSCFRGAITEVKRRSEENIEEPTSWWGDGRREKAVPGGHWKNTRDRGSQRGSRRSATHGEARARESVSVRRRKWKQWATRRGHRARLQTISHGDHELTDMLSEGFSPKDPRADDLGEIRKAAITASSLTRQLLTFSRQQVIEPRLISLNDVVSTSEKMLQRLIGEDVELVTVLTSDPVAVLIDPGQLEQVIMNLAVNSRDSMSTGGRLTIETGRVKMDAEYARDHWPANPGQFAMLAVTDTAAGRLKRRALRSLNRSLPPRRLVKERDSASPRLRNRQAVQRFIGSMRARSRKRLSNLPASGRRAGGGVTEVKLNFHRSNGHRNVLLAEDAAACA